MTNEVPPSALGSREVLASRHFPSIYLISLDKPCLRANGQEVALNSRKAIALLAYLSTRGSLSESRERLAGLLWGDSSEEKARASLRQTLSKIREAVPFEFVQSNRLDVWIVGSEFYADHLEIHYSLCQGTVDDRLLTTQRICSAFLEGYEDIDPSFDNWLKVFRQSLEDKLMRQLETQLASVSSIADRRDVATAILNIEPTHEPAIRSAMISYASKGDVGKALRIYNTLWEVLERDFDSEPSEETQLLVAKIKLGEGELTCQGKDLAQLGIPAPPAKSEISHSLYLGVFSAIGVSSSRQPVITIFRTELAAALTRFRDWRINEYSQVQAGIPQMAHLIEANAYDDGASVRFVLTLRELPSGTYVWSERFNLHVDAWFETMQTIIRRIAVALEINISSERLERLAGKPELSLELFDRWLRGQLSIFRWSPQDEAMAEDLFRSIIAEAPGFAPAFSAMAGILNVRHLIFPGMQRSEEAQKEALTFAQHAVSVDPLDSRTQLHLAWSYAMNCEFQRAGMTFQLAHELNSDDPWTLVSAAEGLALCGSLHEALDLVRKAQQTGLVFSDLQWSYHAVIWFVAREYEKCVTAANKSDLTLNCCGGWAAAALGLLGRTAEASTLARQFLDRIAVKWVLNEKPTDWEITRWLLIGFPISSEEVRQDFARGLEIAGFPVLQELCPPTLRLKQANSSSGNHE